MWNIFKKKAMAKKKTEEKENTNENPTVTEKSFYDLSHDQVNLLMREVLEHNNKCLETLQRQFKFNEHHIVNKTIESNKELIKKMENG